MLGVTRDLEALALALVWVGCVGLATALSVALRYPAHARDLADVSVTALLCALVLACGLPSDRVDR